MRIGYAMAAAALLAATPAMAQITIGGGDRDAARRTSINADRDRTAGRQNMEAAHRRRRWATIAPRIATKQAAHEDWHAAHHQEHDADRDSRGGVTVQLGH